LYLRFFLPIVFAVLLFALGGQEVFAQELITNGGFETGDFTGWTRTATGDGTWNINDGNFDPRGPTGTNSPISGSFDAVADQTTIGKRTLSQTFTVPSNIETAVISWKDRIFNDASSFPFIDPIQEVRVQLVKSDGTLLSKIFSPEPADPSIQVGPNSRSFDITTLLQSLEGQSIKLIIEEESDKGFLNYYVDDVSILVTIDTTSPSQPVNLLPTDGLVDNEDLPFFDWTDSTDALGVDHYTLEIATDSGFTAIVQTHVINPDSFKQLVTGDELAENEYFWRVTATDAANNDSTPSATFSFIVDLTPPTFQNVPADPTIVEGNAANSYDGTITPAYTAPTATDAVDPSPTVVCDILPTATYTYSGTAPTDTLVTCTATDAAGNASQATFNVQVQDTVAPALQNIPADPTIVEGKDTH